MTIGKAGFLHTAGILGAIWGLGGISLLFGSAVFRLCPYAFELLEYPFSGIHWTALALALLFFGYIKGYKVLHLRFSPRVAARVLYLWKYPTLIRILLAPLFCMGYFHATRKRKVMSCSFTVIIIGLIVLVRQLDQPWRGIIDAGVVLALGWGLVSMWLFTIQAIYSENFDVAPETPDGCEVLRFDRYEHELW